MNYRKTQSGPDLVLEAFRLGGRLLVFLTRLRVSVESCCLSAKRINFVFNCSLDIALLPAIWLRKLRRKMTMSKLEKEVRFLKIYAVVTTLLFGVLAFSAFQQASQKMKFSEIDVERLNIVEKDGKLKMVISNSERQHPGIVDGKMLSRKRPPGIIF